MTEAWRKTLVPDGATLEGAVRCLEKSGLQIVLVVGEENTLLGTVTDGDIRRGLLAGASFETPVREVMCAEPLAVPADLALATVKRLMEANKMYQLPAIDDAHRVVGLHVWSELQAPGERPNLFVVMAGGQGARLRPQTENSPKPMLPVGEKPMLEHIILRARQEGFRNFVLAINYLGHVIEDYFSDGAAWDVRVDYVREKRPLGTGGALSLLDPKPDLPFVVSNGDVLSGVRYGEILAFHQRHRAIATMGMRLHQWQYPFGVVQTRGVDIVGFDEKPVHRTNVNAGIYVFEPQVLEIMVKDEYCDIPTLFQRLQKSEARTIAFPMHEHWLDVGRPDDLKRARDLHASAGTVSTTIG